MIPATRVRALLTAATISLAIAACGPKDTEIKASADQAIASIQGATVDVASGVATISGEVADAAAKDAAEAAVKAVKGVKSVVNNATVAPPPPPVVISADDSLKTNVAAALKDTPTLQAEVKDGVITLTGEIQRSALPKVMQALNALRPKKIENKATVKR